MPAKQVRRFRFTLNNPDGHLDDWQRDEVRYFIYSEEIGENGTYHFQGYCELTDKKSFSWIKNNLDSRMNIGECHGSQEENIKYCSKLDDTHIDGPFTWGTPAKCNGVPINEQEIAIRDALQKPETNMMELEDQYFGFFTRYSRFYHDYRSRRVPLEEKADYTVFNVPFQDLSKAVYIHGPSGIGKTQYALAHFKNPLQVRNIDDLKRFTSAHDGIVFDDMSFRHYPAETIIHLLEISQRVTIHARYTDAIIPKGVRRIFTHNESNALFPPMATPHQVEAISRRLVICEYIINLFS